MFSAPPGLPHLPARTPPRVRCGFLSRTTSRSPLQLLCTGLPPAAWLQAFHLRGLCEIWGSPPGRRVRGAGCVNSLRVSAALCRSHSSLPARPPDDRPSGDGGGGRGGGRGGRASWHDSPGTSQAPASESASKRCLVLRGRWPWQPPGLSFCGDVTVPPRGAGRGAGGDSRRCRTRADRPFSRPPVSEALCWCQPRGSDGLASLSLTRGLNAAGGRLPGRLSRGLVSTRRGVSPRALKGS